MRQPLAGLQADPTPTLSTSISQLPGGKHSVSSPLCAQHGVWSGRGQLSCGHNLGVRVGRPGGPEASQTQAKTEEVLGLSQMRIPRPHQNSGLCYGGVSNLGPTDTLSQLHLSRGGPVRYGMFSSILSEAQFQL